LSVSTEDRETWMRLAIDEARKGRTSPNPKVGAVLVRDGAPIATGYHRKAGAPHAEVDAIGNASGPLDDATLYVTLEPCNHRGRTGPCTEAILNAGISKVVIGCADPAPHVPGAIARLESAGVEVEVGVLEAECAELIVDFTKHIRTGLPFVTLKAAVTLDGKIATRTGDSKWITSEEARTEAHRLRDASDAVIVGIGTVLADDPALTVRHVPGVDPIRVVLDADLRTPPSAAVLDPGGSSTAPAWVFHANDVAPDKSDPLRRHGVDLVPVPRSERGVDLEAVLRELGQRDVMRVLVEGGAHVHGSLLDEGLADRAALFIAPLIVGDLDAPSFAAGNGAESIGEAWRLVRTRLELLGPDVFIAGDIERKD
jgi:diaminohydroxyphosphoribosylaminopyrimidine deaminase/5-amino-6-(5-phosphoribosylamino)uracil reductase